MDLFFGIFSTFLSSMVSISKWYGYHKKKQVTINENPCLYDGKLDQKDKLEKVDVLFKFHWKISWITSYWIGLELRSL